jgi:hypothetical protein
MTLPIMEFMRRFLQHVLPRGFMKVRYYGFLSPSSSVSLHRTSAPASSWPAVLYSRPPRPRASPAGPCNAVSAAVRYASLACSCPERPRLPHFPRWARGPVRPWPSAPCPRGPEPRGPLATSAHRQRAAAARRPTTDLGGDPHGPGRPPYARHHPDEHRDALPGSATRSPPTRQSPIRARPPYARAVFDFLALVVTRVPAHPSEPLPISPASGLLEHRIETTAAVVSILIG